MSLTDATPTRQTQCTTSFRRIPHFLDSYPRSTPSSQRRPEVLAVGIVQDGYTQRTFLVSLGVARRRSLRSTHGSTHGGLSFTCGRCDSRATPPSVRSLGRRVYVAVVLMSSSPPDSVSSRGLQGLLGISRRTVLRWRRWWTQDFTRRTLRSRSLPPIAPARLPQGLLDRLLSKVLACDWRRHCASHLPSVSPA